jgi:SepF-like predicted cell division protein (DUF552 family)
MDKYEYKIRAQEIRDLIASSQYEKAAEIADTIDWSRVKKSTFLCTISDLYKINKRYEDAIELLQLAYDRYPGGKDILYSLCELYLSTGDTIRAISTYKEFCQVAGNDIRRYILQYKVYVAQEVSLEERIEVLEELKKRDYREKWAYTLAYLYHRVGLATKCVEECDELISWFGEGKYVDMAMELKMLHQPLNEKQQEMYNHRIDGVVSDSRWEGKRNSNAVSSDNGETKVIPEIHVGEAQPVTEVTPLDEAVALSLGHTQVYKGNVPEPEINVKTIEVNDYNTINLQEALAEGVQEVLENGVTGVIPDLPVNPYLNPTTKKLVGFDEETVLKSDTKEIPGSEDDEMFPHIDFDPKAWDKAVEEELSENSFDDEPASDYTQYLGAVADKLRQTPDSDKSRREAIARSILEPMYNSDTVSLSAEEVEKEIERAEEEAIVKEEALLAQPPEQIATVLSQETDGQIRFVVPEAPSTDKQITGQLNINDVMAEWARMKREHEELNRKQYHEQVKQQTGELFDEFEAAALNGVLETLQKEAEEASKLSEEIRVDYVGTPMQTFEPDATAIGAEVAAMMDEEVHSEEIVADDAEMAEEEVPSEAEVQEALAEEITEDQTETEEQAAANEQVEIQEEVAYVEEASDEVEELAEIEQPEEYDAEAYPEAEEVFETYDENYEETYDEGYESYEETYDETYDETYAEEAEEVSETAPVETETAETIEASEEEETEEPYESNVFDIYTTDERSPIETENRTKKFYEKKLEESKKNVAPEEEEDDDEFVRELTKEEKELFGAYIQSKSARKQLINALENVSMASYSGNIILTGGDGTDTSDLATAIMKDIKQTDSNFSGKVARITGDKLNGKRIPTVIKQLANGALIVEKAGKISAETATDLYRSLDQENLGIVVTFIDTERNIEKLMNRCPALEPLFNVRMNLKPLTADQLAEFAVKYAYEKEYSIDEMGMLALHTQITLRQTATHSVNIVEVRDIVDRAIENVSKKNARHFFDVLLGKRYDEEDMIILGEKDFN